ncbi:hypothetical protein E4U42_006277 [Claviceps africana]|uniref:Uncharacterized protein n=1 Tax=Claviceps africana TaxID=83212 RepID=A0A8K0J374_9HYPO|nr:hypothetical protein E4U42_006277 [Claviceps africana]
MDEITAPPASSDSEADGGGVWPDIHTLAKRRRRTSVMTPLGGGDNFSDISTPPSLTHSPNLVAPAPTATTRGRSAAQQRQRSPKITTADLTSLLPKRTHKRIRDDDDDEDTDSDGGATSSEEQSSSDGEDHGPWSRTRPRRPRRKAPPVPSRAGAILEQQTAADRADRVRRSARAANKTYRSSEDKENDDGEDDEDDGEQRENSHFQPLPDDTFDDSAVVPDVQNTEELLRAARKFIEVDQWELSYEEVAEPSSPQGAR